MTPIQANKTKSLESFFRSQAIRWAISGFILTLLFSLPMLFYTVKMASEKQLLGTARAAARAFRPMILENQIRDAEVQIRKALDLQAGESVVILDAQLNAIYPLQDQDKIPYCRTPLHFCWKNGFKKVSLLYPMYFNDQSEDGLFGYLELSLKPTLDLSVVSILILLLLAAFIGQAFGLSSALSQSAKQLVEQLSFWAGQLKTIQSESPKDLSRVPYSELNPMQDAVDGLYLEINNLRKQVEQKAKVEAQIALLREIGHDLKTPHSLLAKYFALHLDTVTQTGVVIPQEVNRVHRTLKRMGDLLRNVVIFPARTFQASQDQMQIPNRDEILTVEQLSSETQAILEDVSFDDEANTKQIQINFRCDVKTGSARISKTGYDRILENLVRNAVDAVDPMLGRITISLQTIDGCPALCVQDNGPGIPVELHQKVFEFDFTTKPSRGTGLGLGIVNRICLNFGSQLRLESKTGEGALFTVLFQPIPAPHHSMGSQSTPVPSKSLSKEEVIRV